MLTRSVEIWGTRGGGVAAGDLSAGSFELGSSSVEMHGEREACGVGGAVNRCGIFFFFFFLRHPPGGFG
jgi:hypothetical protein